MSDKFNEDYFIYLDKYSKSFYIGYFHYYGTRLKGDNRIVNVRDEYPNDPDFWLFSVKGFERNVVMSVIDNTFINSSLLTIDQKKKIISTMCRPSQEDPSKVAYYENNEKMKAGRLTRIKAGRYLRKIFTPEEVPDHIVEELANKWISENGNLTFKILTKGSDIAEAYENGPNSCMSGDATHFASFPYHPSEAYGTDDEEKIEVDTALAVLYNDQNKLIARAVILKNEKKYYSVYGDYIKLESLLLHNGFEKSDDDFHGKRMRLLYSNKGAIVCPYLDFTDSVSVKGDNIIIGGGDYSANFTNGTVEDCHYCEYCEATIYSEDTYYHRGYNVCRDCYDEHVFYCPVTEDECDNDEAVYVEGTVWYKGYRMNGPYSEYGIHILEKEGCIFQCEHDHEYYSLNEYESVVSDHGCVYEKENFLSRIGFYCEYTEEYIEKHYTDEVALSKNISVSANVDINDKDYLSWLESEGLKDPRFEEKLQMKFELAD